MRLHRFYSELRIGNERAVTLTSSDLIHQIRNVFRLKKGDPLVIFDGTGSDYECTIAEIGKRNIIVDIDAARRSSFTPGREIVLCAALVKKDTFEWIVEKATELGVTKIIPMLAERSEKKSLNEKRLQKIAIEASEQCGRSSIPTIAPIMSLEESIRVLKDARTHSSDEFELLAFHTDAPLLERNSISEKDPIGVFIGPEGGWSLDEVDMFHKYDIPLCSLGNQILRAETAVIASLSQVVFNV